MKKLLLFTIALFTLTQLYAQGWGQTQKIVSDDRIQGAQFGNAVAIDGNYAVVGAFGESDFGANSGGFYIYEKDGSGIWNLIEFFSGTNQFDEFGYSVAIDGDYIIVGAKGQDYNASNGGSFISASGAAYIYEKNGSGTWSQVQKIVASDREALNQFGFKVSISGDYAIIGVAEQDYDESGNNYIESAGATYIFERDGSDVWNEVQKIVTSDREAYDYFGRGGVSISGNYATIGAYQEDEDASGGNTIPSTGSAYIFERDGSGVWNETQKIVASDREQGEYFGFSVSIDGDDLVIGCSQDDSFTGSAYIFKKNGSGVWNETQKITASDATTQDRFGQSVSIDNNRVIVGAYTKNFTIGDATYPGGGAAYIFERDGSGVWNQRQNIYDQDRESSDYFGFSVAISGDNVIVGAYQEDEDENEENTLSASGSAYIFNANEPSTLSIVETNFSAELNAYPNPTNRDITINLGTTYNQIHISITNVLGQEIQTQNLQFSNKIALTLNEKAGIYFINISTEVGKSATIKLIKH